MKDNTLIDSGKVLIVDEENAISPITLTGQCIFCDDGRYEYIGNHSIPICPDCITIIRSYIKITKKSNNET